MRFSHKSTTGMALVLCGILLLIAGFGGSWGVAYGQSAGPTPTAGSGGSISIRKSVSPNTANPGDVLTFSIDIRNNGTTAQTDVEVTDTILDFLAVVSVSSTKGTATFSGQAVTVDIGTLDPQETVTVTIVTRIRPNTPTGASGVNIAEVTTSSGGSTSTTPTNPVAVSVSQSAPGGLPNTGADDSSSLWLLIAGGVCVVSGLAVLLIRRRQMA